jgi:RNA polymerase sigma-70 factor (ECF subfamily)
MLGPMLHPGFPLGLSPLTESRTTEAPLLEKVRRCCAGDANADWEMFHQSFHRLISQVVRRTASRWQASASTDVEDLIQETYLKLYRDRARLLGGLEGRQPGEVYAFVKVLTANLVRDHFKRTHSRKRGGRERHETLDDMAEVPSVRWGPQAMERGILLRQIQRCLEQTADSPSSARRDQTVFWLYYRQGLTATHIAALPLGLTTKGVESLLLRLSKTVREALAGVPELRTAAA